ncbi:dynein axonemal intermediate chain 4 [Pectinophora gossypiella]|uniref:dynein axonemal intermediate chain 4 n=1 Tax=Pectinophora gossypiella TaxID=13191 RepID=UPI00214EF39E|nr:dynein axonemal intermediate chain 4 [Pectinophora gossypiella]
MSKDETSQDLSSQLNIEEDKLSTTTATASQVEASTESKTRRTSGTFCFMDKRQKYRVINNDIDMTPDDLIDTDYLTMEHTFTHAAYETKQRRKSETGLKAGRSRSDMGMKVYATTIDLDDIHIDHTIDTEEGYPPTDFDVEQAPSAYYLPKIMPLTKYPPTIYVELKETPTVYLFSLPSFSYDKGTADGRAAEEENENYAYITVGKGRNRKMGFQETQTRYTMFQTRHSLSTRPKKKNQMCFASVWDMYDTYAQLAQEEEEESDDEMVMYQSAAAYLLRKKRLKKKKKKPRTTFEEIGQTQQFFDAAMLCNRVLASKDYAEAQKKFRGLVSMDPLAPDLVYIYTMQSLWYFESEETLNRPIMSVAFNPKNPDILAVAHGKFGYAEKLNGIVCIWCTKNPCTPERRYRFETPVTSVSFANRNPNWIACAFANGDICILDITSYSIKVIAKSKRDTNPCFEPIWATSWVAKDKSQEYVMAAGQDGRISRFTSTKTHDFICTPMMRICAVEGKMKGLETPKPCLKVDVPIIRYPAALCLRWHPVISHIYLVGTDEGCIHRCSTHYLNQHMDVFKAHSGPVYSMIYSPFMTSLLVTCGADNAIRIWIEDLDDVIMTLNCASAVYDVAFCPTNATILISVSGNVMAVWDLRRKTHIPCTEYTFPGNVTLTYVKFSPSGDNLFVADTMGRVHTFHLEDTPIAPYYQRRMLDDAIKRALCTRPLLLLQLEKLERFRDKYNK